MPVERLSTVVSELCSQPMALADGEQTRDLLRRVRDASDRLAGLEAAALDHLDETGAYAEDGASSALGWARRELRLTPEQLKIRRSAGRTMRRLPAVGDALRSGRIRLDHVRKFTAGLTRLGTAVMDEVCDELLDTASDADPATLGERIDEIERQRYPERLDDRWATGMEKHDLTLAKCGDGWHLAGYLDIATGARVASWLKAASAPRGEDDDRSPARRRVDAFGDLVAAALAHGMPTDRGVRPQIHVMTDARWLADQLAHRGDAHHGGVGPVLTGWGPIGPGLLDYLACDADRTDVLFDGFTDGPTPQADILNVGRAQRLATPAQRAAVIARQHGICANPGCGGTCLEIHHAEWWERDGGATDLDNLPGVCPRCHQLIHAGRLVVTADGRRGFVFTLTTGRQRGRALEDHQLHARNRAWLAADSAQRREAA
ncbi:HNH endonuclease signature motif containing protein [Mumia flava]|uniref:HNH endonuclease signature motif containing protein n=1 Tax=Mumia flava TaxID=1348852 RepID=UPI0014774C55|nr:HNH endonuclease signature motif containing protein [Mumia flava]